MDVRSLCHKILQNVSTLLHADRGSLFLVQGERGGGCMPSSQNHDSTSNNPNDNGNPGKTEQRGYSRSRCLVSKLFDVCSRSTLLEMEKKDEIKIPWGTGIVGYVAESGEPVNIPDAYKARILFICEKVMYKLFFVKYYIYGIFFRNIFLFICQTNLWIYFLSWKDFLEVVKL